MEKNIIEFKMQKQERYINSLKKEIALLEDMVSTMEKYEPLNTEDGYVDEADVKHYDKVSWEYEKNKALNNEMDAEINEMISCNIDESIRQIEEIINKTFCSYSDAEISLFELEEELNTKTIENIDYYADAIFGDDSNEYNTDSDFYKDIVCWISDGLGFDIDNQCFNIDSEIGKRFSELSDNSSMKM